MLQFVEQFRIMVAADVRAAVLFALNAHSKNGSDGLQKLKAISRLSGTLDSEALQQYVQHLMAAFPSGQLSLSGEFRPVLCVAADLAAAERVCLAGFLAHSASPGLRIFPSKRYHTAKILNRGNSL